MSWLGGYKGPPKKSDSEDSREVKRKKLESERQQRAEQRDKLRKQVQAAQEDQEKADQAIQDILALEPEILSGDDTVVSESEVENLLAPDVPSEETLNEAAAMAPDPPPPAVPFEAENGSDDEKAMDNLRSVQCPFNKEDVDFWFSQLEDQLTLIGVKAQWTKKIALVRFLPPEIQSEVKSLLKLKQDVAGNIYLKIKKELLELFGEKPEDAYQRAKSRVMTGKPSQLGKAIVDDLTGGDLTCNNCAKTVWGMFRESLPVVVRNHVADLPFSKDTYKEVFKKADQVWDSNRAAEPLPNQQVAAVKAPTSSAEVAAVQKPKRNRGQGQNQSGQGTSQNNGQRNQNRGQGQSQKGQNNKNQNGQGDKKLIDDDNLCRIHAKWKENANFCAAPWGCRMKNVWKSPQ